MGVTRETADDGLRRYYDDGDGILSVTTVLSWLEEDTSGLEYWRRENDGTDDAPYWQHIFWYSGPRGTICHYQALKQFEEHYDSDEDLWGDEEAESMNKIISGPSDDAFDEYDADHAHPDAPTTKSSVAYSILADQGVVSSRSEYETLFAESTTLMDVLMDDTEFFVDKFEYICDELGVDDESVVRVEKYVHNPAHLVAGQTDMVYEDPNGDTVVVDLKTSGSLRQKHRLQAVAYMKAAEQAEWASDTIDRVEVWRIAPSKRNFEVHSHKMPDHAEDLAFYTDEDWFVDPYGDFQYDDIAAMWDKFQELAEVAHDDVAHEA